MTNPFALAAGIAIGGIQLWTDIPSTNTVKEVLSVKREKQLRENYAYHFAENEWYHTVQARSEIGNQPPRDVDWDLETFPNQDNIPPRIEVEVLTIQVSLKHGKTGTIEIMPLTLPGAVDQYIVHENSNLLSDPHMGSAAIGVALFSLPVTLPLSPILLAIRGAYEVLEGQWGMDRREHKLWAKLNKSPLLDDGDREILRKALSRSNKPYETP